MIFIEEVPDFDRMADLREEINEVKNCLTSLSQGNDVVQRATDLLNAAQSLLYSVKNLVCIRDNDETDEETDY